MALLEGWPCAGAGQSSQHRPPRAWRLFWPFMAGSRGGVSEPAEPPCCRCCGTVCVFAPQGSAAACARPAWARCGCCGAAAPMWALCSPSSARPSTSWRERPPSAAFGTGTARSGQPECPPARVRVFPRPPLPLPSAASPWLCPSCGLASLLDTCAKTNSIFFQVAPLVVIPLRMCSGMALSGHRKDSAGFTSDLRVCSLSAFDLPAPLCF